MKLHVRKGLFGVGLTGGKKSALLLSGWTRAEVEHFAERLRAALVKRRFKIARGGVNLGCVKKAPPKEAGRVAVASRRRNQLSQMPSSMLGATSAWFSSLSEKKARRSPLLVAPWSRAGPVIDESIVM